MTVQELIDELSKVEDKTMLVAISDYEYGREPIVGNLKIMKFFMYKGMESEEIKVLDIS